MKNKMMPLGSILLAALIGLPSTGLTKMPPNISVRLLAQQADLIVEGIGIESQRAPESLFPGYVGESKQTLTFNVGKRTLLYFQAQRVYKGSASAREVIKILLSEREPQIPSDWAMKNHHILFLKRTKQPDVYTIVENGQGEFRIFDYNGVQRIKTWFQLPSYRAPEAYPTYHEFVQALHEGVRP